MPKNSIVIGAGFAGLSAASFMAKAGWKVTVVEKQPAPGGRAGSLEAQGFVFDRGPSWYWMPDVFERYFQAFGKKVEDYYLLKRLDPAYRICDTSGAHDIPDLLSARRAFFENKEPGSGKKLGAFLSEAAYKYKTGMGNLVFKPGQSVAEFFDPAVFKGILKLDIFTSVRKHIHRQFKDPLLRNMLEFPALFLGALPENTPALYTLMNHADIVGGTWYPMGGMYKVVDALYQLACELGVEFRFGEAATHIGVQSDTATTVYTAQGEYPADAVIGNADYHFVENNLLDKQYRSYPESYWESRDMAPSALLYYVGLNKRLTGITHHTLFFDASFEKHAQEIYAKPQWPQDPLFYVCAPSVTDPTVAPPGGENLFILIPVAAGLSGDSENLRNHYFDMVVNRLEKQLGQTIRDAIVYKKTVGPTDFVDDYHSYKGNAYGLANTLWQTALFKPSCRSKKVKNLFYTGQLTVPGPGVPPSLISGEIVAAEINRRFAGSL